MERLTHCYTVWNLVFLILSTAALAIAIRCAWNLRKRLFAASVFREKLILLLQQGSGHCGIVAHDGRIISGGELNVNRRESEINKTLRKM